MILALLSLALAADPCMPVAPAAADPQVAELYAQVARDEQAQGALSGAVAAWQLAASRGSEGATRALAQLCRDAQVSQAFGSGLERVQRRDCRGALPFLEIARAGKDALSAALLEGVCDFELRDDAAAREALQKASADPDLAPTAELYLGLLALRSGDAGGALERLRSVAQAPGEGLHSVAGELLRLAQGADRLALEAQLEGGYDSNATLDAFPAVLPSADDGFGAGILSVAFRPLRASGPFLLLAGGYRKYLRYPQSDVGLASGSVGWQLSAQRGVASADYGFDFVSLGPTPWLVRHRGTLRGLLVVDRFILSAEYALRYESFFAVDAKGYTGFRHAIRVGTAVRLGIHTVELAGVLTRSLALMSERASVDVGGELRWTLALGPRWELSAAAGTRWRDFDGVDPDFGLARRELQLEGQLRADVALNAHAALFGLIEARRVLSNVDALTYSRVGLSAGVRFSAGIW